MSDDVTDITRGQLGNDDDIKHAARLAEATCHRNSNVLDVCIAPRGCCLRQRVAA